MRLLQGFRAMFTRPGEGEGLMGVYNKGEARIKEAPREEEAGPPGHGRCLGSAGRNGSHLKIPLEKRKVREVEWEYGTALVVSSR